MVTLVLSLLALSAGPFHTDSAAYASADSCQECSGSQCGRGGCGKCAGCKHRYKEPRGGIMGPMPQTCYGSRYGCYPATERFMNRYPAFHATYYKRAYNYRNYFDYPWHAELHEPSSLFSYETVADNESTDSFAPVLDPGEQTLPPAPVPVVPVSAAYRNAPRPAATAKQPIMPVKQASTLAPIVHIARPEQPILAPIISVQEVAKPQLPLEDAETASTKLLRTLRR